MERPKLTKEKTISARLPTRPTSARASLEGSSGAS